MASIFEEENVVASGMLMEGKPVEYGDGILFCVYAYNVQPDPIEVKHQYKEIS